MPLSGLCALVLDNGRNDGITAACCEGLSKMGAKLALTFVGNDDDEGATMAGQLIEKICQAGGQIVAVRGAPYRRRSCSVQPNGVRFIEELIDQALHDLGHNQIDIMGKSDFFAHHEFPPLNAFYLLMHVSGLPISHSVFWTLSTYLLNDEFISIIGVRRASG